MNAFAQAAAAIHADPNIGEDALYRARGQGPGKPIRVVRSQPDEQAVVFGKAIRTPTLTLRVLCADAPELAQSDAFDLVDRRVLAIDRKLDDEGTSWIVACRDG